MRRLAWLVVLAAGCSRSSPPPAEEARALYDLRCAPCHGATGRGDGPSARGLQAKPRDLGDASWQASVDDAYLRRVIVNGGFGVGLSKEMPGSPDLAARPEVLGGLVGVVRALSARLYSPACLSRMSRLPARS